MRASLWLPTCIFVSAIVHVVLLTAVAVPRQHVTSHGETIMVDLVPRDEAPESVQKEPEQETAPTPFGQAAAAPPSPQAENVAPRPPDNSQRQAQQQQQSQQALPQQQSPQKSGQPQQQAEPPRQAPPQQSAPPEPPTPEVRIGQESPAEQQARLSAMLNLPGPNTGDGTGAEAETKAQLTNSEIAALRAHLKSCWQLPAGVAANQRLKMVIRLSFRPNGALASEPALVEAALSPLGPALLRETMRAIKQCAPYSMLPAEKYREWRVLDIDFSPDQMARG